MPPGALVFLLAATAVLLAALGPGAAVGAAASKPALVKSPKQGQRVLTHSLRFVVRSGPERGDLRAWLNGRPVDKDFRVVAGKRLRVLDASATDGLRYGRNVLKVAVRKKPQGTRFGRAKVRFTVAHRRPLTGAGRDRRIVAGTRIELRGRVKLHPVDSGDRALRWKVVGAPRGSKLRRAHGSAARAAAVRQTLGQSHTLTPSFRPDVPGRYRVKLIASSAKGITNNVATVFAVPDTPLVSLRTAVPPGSADPRPGIEVGGQVLRAPWMALNGKTGSYSGVAGKVDYHALWQLLAFDRSTLELKWNRTYGLCGNVGTNDSFFCRANEAGVPVLINVQQELSELGQNALVVASSHPSVPGASGIWGNPNEGGFVLDKLTGIGFPSSSSKQFEAEIELAKPGGAAGVGVPGMSPGEAKLIVAPNGQLDGYLTPDSNSPKHYGYLPRERIPFDTRFAASCNPGGTCTVAQKVGETEINGSVPPGHGGFLVSGWDRHDLHLIEKKVFVTATGSESTRDEALVATEAMRESLINLGEGGALILVSSIHSDNQAVPVLFTPGVEAFNWNGMVDWLTRLGGTKNGFNVATTTPGRDYSLVAWLGASNREGEGVEATSAGARIRGAFVPNQESLFSPAGVSQGEAPSELLMQMVLRAPDPSWPLDENPEAKKAIAWIGSQVPSLSSDPRKAYWSQGFTPAKANHVAKAVKNQVAFEEGHGFKAEAFEAAKKRLLLELEYVEGTMMYMEKLAQPAGTGKDAWEDATILAQKLEEQLTRLKEKAKIFSEYFAVVQEMIEFGTIFIGPDWKLLTKFATAAAVMAEAGQSLWNTNFQGAATKPEIEVAASELGVKLQEQAKGNEAAFERMGEILVSDWSKLRVVGKYAECVPGENCPAGLEELGWNPEMQKVATAATARGFDSVIHEKLVPLAFPIWNTGLTKRPELAFECSDDTAPFENSPPQARFNSFEEFNPNGQTKNWRVYLSTTKEGRFFSWAPKPILERMFNPVPIENSNPSEGGLAMDPLEFMRTGIEENEFVEESWSCTWNGSEQPVIE